MDAVVKDFERIIALMRTDTAKPEVPYFDYGYRMEIANRLTERDGTQFKWRKYPLIALRMPFTEKMENGFVKLRLNFAIVTSTDPNFTTRQRYEKTILPVLYPLFTKFFEAIKQDGTYFWNDSQELPVMEKIDWPFWGTQYSEGVNANIFNDPLDAIELLDVELNKNINC